MGSISLTLSQFLIQCQLVWAFSTIHGDVHEVSQYVEDEERFMLDKEPSGLCYQFAL